MQKRYLKMLAGMAKRPKRGKREWSVYVLRCAGNSLYTGIAKDVDARLKQHRSGKGAAYTRTHLPVELLVREDGYTRSGALIREAGIKRLPKEKKEALVAGRPPLGRSPNAMIGRTGCRKRTSPCAKASGLSKRAPATTCSVPRRVLKPASAIPS